MAMTAAERFVKRMFSLKGAEEVENEKAVSSEEGGAAHQGIGEISDVKYRERALEAALDYLQKEGEEIERNPFSKGWAIKEGYGKDGKPTQQISSEKGVKDELYEALVADEALPDGQTLQEHDRRHHPNGFNPETDTCKFRERLATETETDKGDILDKDKSSGSKETSETSNGIVSPEYDRKYLDAVERGDIKTAQKMVDAVAKRYFGDSAVLGKVWHNTKKKFTEFKNSFPNVFFFAKDKKWADKFGSDERFSGEENTKAYYLDIQKPIDMRAEKSGKDWLSYFAEHGVEIGENGKNKLERFGDGVIPGYAILNHDSSEPYGTGFRDAMVKAGFDGAILEDIKRGTADRTSYGAFNSTGIKSADAVTYDDNGNVIPLSRRFDKGTDIRGDISGNQSEQQNGKAEQDNTRAYEGLSNKQVKKYKDLMAKKHPELDADLVLTELGKIKDKKVQGDAFAWVMRGTVKLPEDLYKVEQARELATKAKKDPLSYNTPQDCINQLMGEGHKVKEKPITVEELKKNPLMSDYRDEGYGVETFQVEDSREGQALMRQVLNTHWGKDANPWCLLHGDGEGNLSYGSDGGYDAWEYWNHYNALPKRVAFKDGKLLAFMGTDGSEFSPEADELREEYEEFDDYKKYDMPFDNWLMNNYPDVNPIGEQWWDRKDEPHNGIPIGEIEVPNDELHRLGEGEIREGKVVVPEGQPLHVGEKEKPGYKRWVGGRLVREITKDGDKISYYNGIPSSIHRIDGSVELYNNDGNLERLTRYDKDGYVTEDFKIEEYVDKDTDGKPTIHRYVSQYQDNRDGKNKSRMWYTNGNLVQKTNNDGGVTAWDPRGYVMYKDIRDEDGVTSRYKWDSDGELKAIGNREPTGEEKEKYRQRVSDPEAIEKAPEIPKGLWDEMKEKSSKQASDERISLPNGNKIKKSHSYLYTDSKGQLHNEKWSVAREKKLGDGRISKEFSTTLDTLLGGKDVSDESIMALPEWKEAMDLEKDIEGRLQKEYGVTRTQDINTKARNRFRDSIVEAALSDHITKTVPIEGYDGEVFETNEGLEEGESYDVENGKKVFIAIGLPAAGKSTTFANPLAKKYKARLCDSDTVKKVLPEFANGYGGNLVHDESTAINERILAGAIDKGDNIVYPILGYKPEKLQRLMKMFKDKGYEVNLCFKDMPANIAKGRLLGRFLQKGRYLPLTCISKAQGKVGDSFDAVKDLADAYIRSSSEPDGSNDRIIESKGNIL